MTHAQKMNEIVINAELKRVNAELRRVKNDQTYIIKAYENKKKIKDNDKITRSSTKDYF